MNIDLSECSGARNSVSKLLNRLANRVRMTPPQSRTLQFEEALIAKKMATKPDDALAVIVRSAWNEGQTIDLSNVGYGPAHWDNGNKPCDKPMPYYHFLAGFVRSQNCKRIFEIGTHFGGSIISMHRGITEPSKAQIITVDISNINPAIHHMPGVTKITGDANSDGVIKLTAAAMGGEPIDLLYIDAAHEFGPTMINLGVYIFLLQPRFVLIDDIVLNDEMRSLWNAVCATRGSNAINCADVVPEIRTPNVGFGLLRH